MDNTQSPPTITTPESSTANTNSLGFMSGYMNKTVIQALIFGIVAVLLGMLFVMIFSVFKPELPQECAKWNENFIMEMILFLVGFTMRYLMSCDTVRKYMVD
jgi:hypothetical protein